MPHVSRYKIEDKLYSKLFDQLVLTQQGLTKGESREYLYALFTKTERIMFTKRCAAVVMFYEGCSQYKVWNTLKISPSTAARIRDAYDKGNYRGLVILLKKNKFDTEKFRDTLELILRAGMPSRGKDRWTSL